MIISNIFKIYFNVLTNMKILLTFFVLLFSSSVVAESYYCSYLFNNESQLTEFKRLDNNSFNRGEILAENDKLIYIGHTVEGYDHKGYRILIIDKKIKKFRMIALHNPEYEKERSAIVQGDCKVSN